MVLLLTPVTAAAQDDVTPAPLARTEPSASAREHIDRGNALFERGHYDAALAELLAAYDQLEGHPRRHRVLYDIALCYERSFRYDEALAYYARYLREGGETAENASEVRAIVRILEGLLGTVRFEELPTGTEIWVGEHRVAANAASIRIPPGSHALELRAEGFVPARSEIHMVAGGEQTIHVVMRPVDAFGGLPRELFWVSLATSAATLATGAGFGIDSLVRGREIETRLASPYDRWSVTQAQIDDVATSSLVADVLYGAGALLAVTTVVFALLTRWDDEPDAGGAGSATVRLVPFGVAGRF